jgi:hypothetical protein
MNLRGLEGPAPNAPHKKKEPSLSRRLFGEEGDTNVRIRRDGFHGVR